MSAKHPGTPGESAGADQATEKTGDGRPFIDTDRIELPVILAAAEEFLAKHGEYTDFLSGPGRQSDTALTLGWEVLVAAEAMDRAIKAAGLTSSAVKGTNPEKTTGLSILMLAAKGLPESLPEKPENGVQKPIILEGDERLQFNAEAVAQIAFAVRRLKRIQAPPEAAGPQEEPNRQKANIDWNELIKSSPLPAARIAEKLGQPAHLVERVLRYQRKVKPFCFVQDDSPQKGNERYLHKMPDVLPALKKWVGKRLRKQCKGAC